MNLRHYKIFLKVCEIGNMTQAAKALYMTQPSVSQVISEMEKEYGVLLFERLNRRLFITAAGEQLRTYASHIINLSEQARKDLAELGSAGSLHVGASQTVGAYLLPQILQQYLLKKPQVDLYSTVDNTQVIETLLLEDQIDIGIVEGQIQSKYIKQEKLCDDELITICGKGHAFWDKEVVHLSDLAGWGFIIREPGSGTRDLFERIMAQSGIPWKIAGEYHNTESIKKAVIMNLALAVVPRISIIDEIQSGLLKEIHIPQLNLQRKFDIVYHKQKYITPAIQQFIETSRQWTRT
jgi:LysR family transcriptional regulator, transcriptional activator of the cysJI operon